MEPVQVVGGVAQLSLAGSVGVEELRGRLEALLESDARVLLVMKEGRARLEPPGAGYDWLAYYRLPIVFAWEGELSDGALNFALHCDIRICGEGSTLQYHASEAERAGYGWLAMLLPRARAAELGSGIEWRAEAALEAGLVSVLTGEGGAAAEGKRLAEVIARRGPLAVELAKEAIWRGLQMPLGQGLRLETDLTLLLQTTKDRAEGVAAFMEKREPHFTGE